MTPHSVGLIEDSHTKAQLAWGYRPGPARLAFPETPPALQSNLLVGGFRFRSFIGR